MVERAQEYESEPSGGGGGEDKVNDNEPWIYSQGVYHFYLHSMGWILEHLFHGLMNNKGWTYEKAVQHVYDNTFLKIGKIEGREIFVIPNDEDYEQIIVAGVRDITPFSGPIV